MTAEEMWEEFKFNCLNTGVFTVAEDEMEVIRVAFISGVMATTTFVVKCNKEQYMKLVAELRVFAQAEIRRGRTRSEG